MSEKALSKGGAFSFGNPAGLSTAVKVNDWFKLPHQVEGS